MLKNGSLFIYNFTEEDEGYFQCSSLVLDRLLYSSIYNISLSGDEESKFCCRTNGRMEWVSIERWGMGIGGILGLEQTSEMGHG